MFKKILAWILVVSLTAAIAIGGTLAYLTDRDSVANIFTVGNVNITLEEEFEQESQLMPGKDINKVVQIKNEGPNDAWVWYTYAIPAALDTANDASANVLHVNHAGANWLGYQDNQKYWAEGQTEATPADQCWIPDYNPAGNGQPVGTVEVEGIVYNVYAVLYNGILPAGETTTVGMTKVYLDSTVDITPDGDLYKVVAGETTEIGWNVNDNENPVIFINAYAIQTQDFETVQAAYAAFEGQWGTMAGAGTYDLTPPTDTWDGTSDTSWYNNTDTEFVITTAEQMAGLSELVDGGNTFEGKTVKLSQNIDLYAEDEKGERISFNPIGDEVAFEGTFDGQGNTIENLYQSGWDFGYEWGSYGSIGLFGELKDATVKNLTISGAESLVEGGDVGGITGSATGTCVFENITIEDSVFATYNNGNGGIIGWSGAGEYTFKNITIAEDTVLAGLWGSFDSSIGGVVGQGEPGATYNFENVDIACRLDVYNDCTASYDYYNYRMCGMIIGRLQKTTTIDGTNYPDMSQYNITCTDVTVTYGEWANYHYCDPTTPDYNNGRGMRVEAGYSYDGIPEDYDHSQCTTHHNELIEFDQIFGGAQLGVKGLPSYDGVTVIYNNK